MASQAYEFLVKDDGTRQAFRELWEIIDALNLSVTAVSQFDIFSLIVNAEYNSSTGQWHKVNVSLPSWAAEASATGDFIRILRSPAGASIITWEDQGTWNSTGFILPLNLTLSTMTPGSILFAGTAGLVSQDNAHLFWVDATNRLSIGAIDPDFDLQVTTESASYPRGIAIYQHSSDFRPPIFVGRKSRGTHAARTQVLTNDILVEMAADAWHSGADWGFGGAVLIAAAENWTATAWGNRLEFWTGLIGAAAPQRRWVMDDVGHLWPSDDNVKDIGITSPSSLRPRNINLGRGLFIGAPATPKGRIHAKQTAEFAVNSFESGLILERSDTTGQVALYVGSDGVAYLQAVDSSGAYISVGPQNPEFQIGFGDLGFADDNGHDIGQSAANRPKDVYVGTSVRGPGTRAAAGFLRLANAALVAWRNVGNTADLSLNVNASDQYEWVNGAHRIASVNRFRMLQAMVRVRQSADQAITTATPTAITFDTEDFDTDTLHDSGSNPARLTAAIAGKYLVQAGVDWESNATGNRKVEIVKNGTTGMAMSWISANLTDRTAQNVCALVDLAAAEYVEVIVTHTVGANLNALSSDDTFLSMVYVGE